jgi:toxin ParE1/3/4
VSTPVHWSDVAVQHLARISLYIGRTSPLYADRIVERILSRVDALAEFPELGLRTSESPDENVREILENPYRILYLAQPTRVDILAIVHARQDVQWPKP